MRRYERGMAAALLIAGLALGACARTEASGGGEDESYSQSAAKVEAIEGSDLSRVSLSERAAARIGLKTTRVRAAGGGRTAVPYDAVLYDEQGQTWVYTATGPMTFVRQRIAVERITGDQAVLSRGPRAGSTVVTVGSEELLGAELGVGGD